MRLLAGAGAFGVCAGGLAGCRRAVVEGSTVGPLRDHGHGEPEASAHGHEDGAGGSGAGEGEAFASLRGFCDGAEAIGAGEFAARIDRVRAELKASEAGALIVEAGVDMRYLGGPRWGRSERPLLLALARRGPPTLIGPAFEGTRLEAVGREGAVEFDLELWQEHEDPYALALASLESRGLARGDAVATGPAMRSFVVEGLRQAARSGLQADSAAVDRCRRIKSPAELALLRRANRATKAAIAAAAPKLRVGMHEREFAEIVAEAQRAAGLDNPWVLALFGPNAAYPHGTPEGRALAEGDLVLVDTGGFLHGYASDITRTWAFPDPEAVDGEARRAFEVVRRAQARALERIAPGVPVAEVDAAARQVVAEAGFSGDYGHFTHRLGHGIGLQVHETPYLVRGGEHRLEPGNTMSVEPGVYLPGSFGVRIEDIVAVGEDGAELFGPRSLGLDDPFGAGA